MLCIRSSLSARHFLRDSETNSKSQDASVLEGTHPGAENSVPTVSGSHQLAYSGEL